MSMVTRVVGMTNVDDLFERMLRAKEALDAARVAYPQELIDYFGGRANMSAADLRQEATEINIAAAVTERSQQSVNVWEVDLAKLPVGVKKIVFSNSY